MLKRILSVFFMLAVLSVSRAHAHSAQADQTKGDSSDILANFNREPAGLLENGVLTIKLEARTGLWYPETKDGPGLPVQAFGEEGGPLQVPAPLIRVPEGTEIHATIRNSISGSTLIMHGFHTRPGNAKDTFEVRPGQTREVRFKAGSAGTYFYWATTGGVQFDGRPYTFDSQLTGALIVDPPGYKMPVNERVFVLTYWIELAPDFTIENPKILREVFAINGRSWPYTERFTFKVGDTVNWRWVNPTIAFHPMHLHGFYYLVNSKGDDERDHIYEERERRQVVTELMLLGSTMTMTWVPERPGNWLFHCHASKHISPALRLRPKAAADEHSAHDPMQHAMNEMAGLVLGIHVLSAAAGIKVAYAPAKRRNITLVAQEQPGRFGGAAGLGFVLQEGNTEPPPNKIRIPGPPILLTRGEPTSIKVVNRLRIPTSVHWHGIEIESYFDGVAGWGTNGSSISPTVPPGGSFVAEMTPPRAGTFIYHTHHHDDQLSCGLYGPLIVLEPGQVFDPATDLIMLLSVGGPGEQAPIWLNGSKQPDPIQMRVGVKYRFRLINITQINGGLSLHLLSGPDDTAVNWRAIAKDGAYLPPNQAVMKPAHQTVTVGETYDFEYVPTQPGNLRLEVRFITGKRVIEAKVQVR